MHDVNGDLRSAFEYVTNTAHYSNHVRFMRYGFMPDRGTTDAIFALQQITEKLTDDMTETDDGGQSGKRRCDIGENRKYCMVCIDLKKAYYRVPCQEVWRCTREKEVHEKDNTGYVRTSENPGKKHSRNNGQDPSGRWTTPMFFRHDVLAWARMHGAPIASL